MKKEEHIRTYHFFRSLLGNYFLNYYKPKMINKEVIPENGPIILCGNHIHLYDQCLPIMSTKRMLHYMAKKEYFDGKFAWFFKANGCISVDRANHGGNSINIAEQLLRDGYGIGIYPEGTRNSLVSKEEKFPEIYSYVKEVITEKDYKQLCKDNLVLVSQTDYLLELYHRKVINLNELKKSLLDVNESLLNLVKEGKISEEDYNEHLLLPLKFGAVSMAQKTKATIVPYAICGKYSHKNNHLQVRFGKPFNVSTTMNLENANKQLRKAIISLIIDGNEDIKSGKI